MKKNITPDFVARAREIISEMDFDSYFWKWQAVKKYNREHNTNFNIRCGAAREVIVCDTFVIKFDKPQYDEYGGNFQELKMYKTACKDGYGYLFAPIFKIKVKNHYYYVMQFVPHTSYLEKDENYDIEAYLCEDEAKYVRTHCYDLHNGNYGFINNYPVITDYAWNTLWA